MSESCPSSDAVVAASCTGARLRDSRPVDDLVVGAPLRRRRFLRRLAVSSRSPLKLRFFFEFFHELCVGRRPRTRSLWRSGLQSGTSL